jgi:hypothetical protein
MERSLDLEESVRALNVEQESSWLLMLIDNTVESVTGLTSSRNQKKSEDFCVSLESLLEQCL